MRLGARSGPCGQEDEQPFTSKVETLNDADCVAECPLKGEADVAAKSLTHNASRTLAICDASVCLSTVLLCGYNDEKAWEYFVLEFL